MHKRFQLQYSNSDILWTYKTEIYLTVSCIILTLYIILISKPFTVIDSTIL